MSDEVVFEGEVRYREPRRARRPDLDRAFACLACDLPGPADLPIFLDRGPADAIERHALRDTSVELGGILLGRECVDEETGTPFVWITESIEAKHYENSPASFTYTHASWEEISREREAKHPDADIVGWYHTHPDFGVFLSGHDLFIHHHFFTQPLQVAYVVDPIRRTRGFFRWRSGAMAPVGGFHLTAPRGERRALASLADSLEQIDGPEPPAPGPYPRLEAELIAMLHRSTRPAPAAADRPGASGAPPLVLGLVLGLALAGAGAWINSIGREVREQSAAIRDLAAAVERSASAPHPGRDEARSKGRDEAIDALLRDVRDRPGVAPAADRLMGLLARANADRDEATRAAGLLETQRLALAHEQGRLIESEKSARAELAAAQEEAARAARATESARAEGAARLREAEETLADRGRLVDDERAGRLASRYAIAWYVASGALAGCVLLGLGLLSALARLGAAPAAAPERPAAPDDDPGPAPKVVIR